MINGKIITTKKDIYVTPVRLVQLQIQKTGRENIKDGLGEELQILSTGTGTAFVNTIS